MKRSVLVMCPHPMEKGGVAHYYALVRKYFDSDQLSLDFYYTGIKSDGRLSSNRLFKSISDLLHLCKIIPRYNLIMLNPSLDAKAVIRDGIYHLIAKRIFRKKTLVMFRGWDLTFERLIDHYAKPLFKYVFCGDKILVLAERIKQVLVNWGFAPEIIGLETTTCEEHVSRFENDPFKVVFLSRFAKDKGALEAIKSIEILLPVFPQIKLYMAGDGELSSELRAYVSSHNLSDNIEFTGWLEGTEKYDLLSQCGIMLYPTCFGEGMPNSILEGMALGLAIVTRPVAGLADIIMNGENGFLIQSTEPRDFAEKLTQLYMDRDLWERISRNNKTTAKDKFEVKAVVKRLERIFIELAR